MVDFPWLNPKHCWQKRTVDQDPNFQTTNLQFPVKLLVASVASPCLVAEYLKVQGGSIPCSGNTIQNFKLANIGQSHFQISLDIDVDHQKWEHPLSMFVHHISTKNKSLAINS